MTQTKTTLRQLETKPALDACILRAAKGHEISRMVASVMIMERPELIRRLRELAGMTQKSLAKTINCYDSYISIWETGKRDLTIYFANAIVRAVAAELGNAKVH